MKVDGINVIFIKVEMDVQRECPWKMITLIQRNVQNCG